MLKNKFGKWKYTDAEIDGQIRDATLEAQKASKREPRAKNAYYDKERRQIVLELSNGHSLGLNPEHFPELAHARPDQLEKVEITPGGIGLHWETLDVDYRVPELVLGVLGPDAWKQELARKAGQVVSAAKANAARRNGLKGGRPPKRQERLPAHI